MTAQSERTGGEDTPFDPRDVLTAVETSTTHFLATAARLDDDDVRGPSLLPGWTRGHVLAHVARNADGLVNLLTWARTGVETPQYASVESRNADIERDAGRSAAAHLEDLTTSARVFAAAVAAMPPDRWGFVVRWRAGNQRPARGILTARLREVEIHHVDLDVDYTPAHWHTDFSGRVLDGVTTAMTAERGLPPLWLHASDTDRRWAVGGAVEGSPRVSGPEAALLAWLIGRSSGDGLVMDPHDTPLPAPPPWA